MEEDYMPISPAMSFDEPMYTTMGAPDMPMLGGAPDMTMGPIAYSSAPNVMGAPDPRVMPQPNFRGPQPQPAGFNQNTLMQLHNYLMQRHPGYAQQVQRILQQQPQVRPISPPPARPQPVNTMPVRPQPQARPQMPQPMRPQPQAMAAIQNALRLAQGRRG